jgi:hypothetical protein
MIDKNYTSTSSLTQTLSFVDMAKSPLTTQRLSILELSLEKFSQLANLKEGEFITYSNGRFEKHKNTLCNRIVYCFHSKILPLNAIDTLVSECAKDIELLRLNFDPSSPNSADIVNAEKALLQQMHSTSITLFRSLNNLKAAYDRPEIYHKIQSLQSKISILDNNIVSLNNFMTRFKKISTNVSSLDSLIKKFTSDTYIDKYIEKLLQKQIIDEKSPSYFSLSAAVAALSKIFGDKATQNIINMYEVESSHFISSTDLKAVIIGIVANMTLEDLQAVCNSENKNLWILAKQQKALLEIKRSPSADFLNYLRQVSLFSKEETAQLKVNKPPYLTQLKKDQYFLKNCLRIDHFNHHPTHVKAADLKHFAYAEYLARNIAYGLYPSDEYASFREGTLVPVPSENGQTFLMQAHTLQNKRGLYGIVLIPANLDSQNSSHPIPVKILFRGSRNYAAWNRNLNPLDKLKWREQEGPGARSFEANRPILLNNLERILQKLPKDSPVKFEILGHSLGACDGERMCQALASKILRARYQHPQPKDAVFHKLNVQEINFFGFNTPGIEENINESFMQSATQLPDIKFQLRYFKAHHDPVQTVAKFLLGYHEEENLRPANVLTSVFNFAKPESAFGNNPINRYGLIPHTQYNLSKYSHPKRKIPNDVWIWNVKTNNPQDSGIKYYRNNPSNEPSESLVDEEKARKALFNQKWGPALRGMFLQLIGYVGEQIRQAFAKVRGSVHANLE